MNGLTQRQQMVLNFLRQSLAEQGYPPTLREIGEVMGIRSTNGVNDHLRALERKGFLQRRDMKSRGIRLLDENGRTIPCGPQCDCPASQALRLRVAELEEKLIFIRSASA